MGVLVNSLLLVTVLCHCAAVFATDLVLKKDCINGVSECPGDVMAQYPVCGDCGAFIKCAGNARHALFHCSSALLYDVNLGVCQFSFLAITSCVPATTTTTVTTTTSPAQEDAGIPGCVTSCDGQLENVYPSCQGCEYFFVCFAKTGGRAGEARCLEGREWDNNIQQCVSSGSPTCSRRRHIE